MKLTQIIYINIAFMAFMNPNRNGAKMNNLYAQPLTSMHDDQEIELEPTYIECLSLVERLHRRLLDVVKDEFERLGWHEVNAVQALLLHNIADKELTAGELKSRGYYLGSNVSYNLKKLVDMQFIEHHRSSQDKRSVRIKLTPKGQEVRETLDELFARHVAQIEQVGDLTKGEMAIFVNSLRKLERFWADQIRFRL